MRYIFARRVAVGDFQQAGQARIRSACRLRSEHIASGPFGAEAGHIGYLLGEHTEVDERVQRLTGDRFILIHIGQRTGVERAEEVLLQHRCGHRDVTRRIRIGNRARVLGDKAADDI
ncbi:hypothetical protein SDC9_173504 [bioreactor metagenome]|uniref:Uncharacterized protein n=1 Tax=bioreactor metagenome TaxID=1076179 RepID=A0A645GJM2_9ZZZZ